MVIVNYDPQWPILFEEEKHRVLNVVGHIVLAVEHVGGSGFRSEVHHRYDGGCPRFY